MSRPTKREINFAGLPINVEIERGDTKRGVDEAGNPWEHTYQHPYGEIQRTQGEDGDPVDVYLGEAHPSLCEVFVVHQLRMDGPTTRTKSCSDSSARPPQKKHIGTTDPRSDLVAWTA